MIEEQLYRRIIEDRSHFFKNRLRGGLLKKNAATRKIWETEYLQLERRVFGNTQRKEKHLHLLNTCKEKQNGISAAEYSALLDFFDENSTFRGKYFIH